MPYVRFLWFMGIATLLGLSSLFGVIFRIDPRMSGWIGPVSFYVSCSLVSLGGFFLFGALFHRIFSRGQTVLPRHVRCWFRRSALLSLIMISSLLLASIDVFSFPVFLLFLVLILGLEGFFLYINIGRR